MPTPPTGTITFLFTDIEGSTSLWERRPEAMRADVERHENLLHEAIGARGGHVFKTVGDAFCAAFALAPDALHAALDLQRALLAEPWNVPAPGLRVRAALHTGEAQERDGDYFGPALSRIARLRDAGHGGQTLLSQATEQLVRDRLPAGAGLADMGAVSLKDLTRPEHVFQLRHADLPGDFPPLRSLDRLPHNLPQRLDSFVGRERELAEVKRLLAGSRLLTLTGMGGTGKTRLSQQAAAESADAYPDGVWLVGLEALSDPALVAQAVAGAVGVREQPGQPLTATLGEALRAQRLLLILDNCEHLLLACASLAQTLLQSCPGVQILATSREPLGIAGEATYPVPTLPVPSSSLSQTPDALRDGFESVRLFVDRATLSLPSFALTDQNAPAVARICRQLDGIPLAIELAAPRVRMLSPDQISQRLDNRFRLLTGGSRTALPRQQTMRALIDWSCDLLSESERLLFRRLSVFAGGWTLEAAEQICSGDGVDEYDVLDLLSALVAKSLVQVDEGEGGCERRYRMLETLREYSDEQRRAAPDADALSDRHRDWFLALAERAEPELRGSDQASWLACLAAEHDNMRAALACSGPETRLRLATALHRFWWLRGFTREGRGWLEEAFRQAVESDSPVSPAVRALALTAAGILAWSQEDYDAAWLLHEQSLALYQEQADAPGVAKALMNLGIVSDFREDFEAARQNYEAALAAYRQIGDKSRTAYALVNLAAHLLGRDDPDAAVPYLEECLTIRRAINDQAGIALVLLNFGEVAFKQRDWTQAKARYIEALHIRQGLGDQPGMVACLFHLACVEREEGQLENAVLLLAAVEALRETASMPLAASAQHTHDGLKEMLQQALGTDVYRSLWQRGRTMPQGQVSQLILTTTSDGAQDRTTVPGGTL